MLFFTKQMSTWVNCNECTCKGITYVRNFRPPTTHFRSWTLFSNLNPLILTSPIPTLWSIVVIFQWNFTFNTLWTVSVLTIYHFLNLHVTIINTILSSLDLRFYYEWYVYNLLKTTFLGLHENCTKTCICLGNYWCLIEAIITLKPW